MRMLPRHERTASTEQVCGTNRESGDSFTVQPMSCKSMQSNNQQSRSRSKPLFTPGPLTTSPTVKTRCFVTLVRETTEFIEVVRRIRHRLLDVAGVSQQSGYECVLMQGSGTLQLESVISSAMPPQSKLLVVVNGAYGERIVAIARRHGIETVVVRAKRTSCRTSTEVDRVLATHPINCDDCRCPLRDDLRNHESDSGDWRSRPSSRRPILRRFDERVLAPCRLICRRATSTFLCRRRTNALRACRVSRLQFVGALLFGHGGMARTVSLDLLRTMERS